MLHQHSTAVGLKHCDPGAILVGCNFEGEQSCSVSPSAHKQSLVGRMRQQACPARTNWIWLVPLVGYPAKGQVGLQAAFHASSMTRSSDRLHPPTQPPRILCGPQPTKLWQTGATCQSSMQALWLAAQAAGLGTLRHQAVGVYFKNGPTPTMHY